MGRNRGRLSLTTGFLFSEVCIEIRTMPWKIKKSRSAMPTGILQTTIPFSGNGDFLGFGSVNCRFGHAQSQHPIFIGGFDLIFFGVFRQREGAGKR